MLGNFAYHNPTKLYFGDESLDFLNKELPNYGDNVVLVYGGGSIKKNGVYQDIMDILQKNGKKVAEISGVMPNPTLEKLYEGTAMKIRGINTLSALKNRPVPSFPWAASSPWPARVRK